MYKYTDDQQLINDVKNGVSEAFEYLFSTYYPRLRNFASRFITDEDDANDIIQNCYTNLWERRHNITCVSISSLLYTMVRNGCLNFIKHQALVNNYNIEYLARLSGSEQLYNKDFLNNSDSELLYNELQRQIEALMMTLPERSRQIFRMSRYDGLKNREIAEELGISIKVVEKHISRALAAFRKKFGKELTSSAILILTALYFSNTAS